MRSDKPEFSRRVFLLGASASALVQLGWADVARAQAFPDFAAVCRDLSGFTAIPRAPLQQVATAVGDKAQSDLIAGQASAATCKQILKMLYTGTDGSEDTAPVRLAYTDALMYAAVEDSLNVPSYCGGLPGYWSEKPVDV
ncbi:sugar dehydrogenase complex small subunit [Stappia stellulata]|uniref:sugar dehydrogenase complex small subunit n=1 Tax=Stappia stellulata TaxID=71235 RepID=UPI00041ACF71|nr:sugar dehydrogenase complex small subunit [Stappia stellulata]